MHKTIIQSISNQLFLNLLVNKIKWFVSLLRYFNSDYHAFSYCEESAFCEDSGSAIVKTSFFAVSSEALHDDVKWRILRISIISLA